MCFYESIQFDCNCWRWGNMRQQCQKEYRRGETCGAKFVFGNVSAHSSCTICQSLEKKERRLKKMCDDYVRWKDDPQRQCSAEKAVTEIRAIQVEIAALKAERDRRYNDIGSNRRV